MDFGDFKTLVVYTNDLHNTTICEILYSVGMGPIIPRKDEYVNVKGYLYRVNSVTHGLTDNEHMIIVKMH
jgi:hypothetical protein